MHEVSGALQGYSMDSKVVPEVSGVSRGVLKAFQGFQGCDRVVSVVFKEFQRRYRGFQRRRRRFQGRT